jgi:D-amino peptidase
MEGVSGVVDYAQVRPDSREYETGRNLLMSDLLALLTGLREGGAEHVVIYDEHSRGRNVDLRALPEFATVVCGKPPYTREWPGGLEEGHSGLILLGFHAMAGVEGALMPHTYEREIRALVLNETPVGEISMEAAIAGDHGVPMVLVTGDFAGVAEAAALRPESLGVVVKDSLDSRGALCYPAAVTASLIRQAAAQVVQNPPQVEPYRVESPVELRVVLEDGDYLDRVQSHFPGEFADDRTLVINGDSATDVWAQYWRKKLTARGDRR